MLEFFQYCLAKVYYRIYLKSKRVISQHDLNTITGKYSSVGAVTKILTVFGLKFQSQIFLLSICSLNYRTIKNDQKGVDWRGFEPLTPRVQGEYSTAELPAHYRI